MAEFVVPPRMLSTEALAEFETALQRAHMMAQPNPSPKPAPRPPAPAPKPSAPPLASITKPKSKAARQPIIEAAGPGQVQARVQRNGYSKTDDGPQYSEGDIVAVSAETARIAIAHGALDGTLQ